MGSTNGTEQNFFAYFPANNALVSLSERVYACRPRCLSKIMHQEDLMLISKIEGDRPEKLGEDLARDHIADGEEGNNTT
jgi:hypothetical protein